MVIKFKYFYRSDIVEFSKNSPFYSFLFVIFNAYYLSNL
jgi:hypothetical protein